MFCGGGYVGGGIGGARNGGREGFGRGGTLGSGMGYCGPTGTENVVFGLDGNSTVSGIFVSGGGFGSRNCGGGRAGGCGHIIGFGCGGAFFLSIGGCKDARSDRDWLSVSCRDCGKPVVWIALAIGGGGRGGKVGVSGDFRLCEGGGFGGGRGCEVTSFEAG